MAAQTNADAPVQQGIFDQLIGLASTAASGYFGVRQAQADFDNTANAAKTVVQAQQSQANAQTAMIKWVVSAALVGILGAMLIRRTR